MEELEAIDSPLSEEEKIATLFNGLTQTYDNVIVSLETRADQVNLEFVMARLMHEESRKEKQTQDI